MASQSYIEHWTKILERDQANGISRLRSQLCSLSLGREFGESVEAFRARKGLTAFFDWAAEQLANDRIRMG